MSKNTEPHRFQRFAFIKKLLHFFGLYSDEGSNTVKPQYIFLRKIHRIFGLYPNIRFKHFYYEAPNSFMAPKIYEFVSMMRLTELKKTDTVLDLGCGEGTLTLALAKSVKKAIGIEIIPNLIADAKFKARELAGRVDTEFHCEKIENLKLAPESFDKVFSFSVIEHIPNYMEVFEELFKLLKKDGELIISVDSFSDFDKDLKDLHRRTFEVQKYFLKEELRDLLLNLGFRDIEIIPIFKSQFAKKWFTRVMKDPREKFDYHKRIYSFFLYHVIGYHERRVSQNDKGIFLLARCVK